MNSSKLKFQLFATSAMLDPVLHSKPIRLLSISTLRFFNIPWRLKCENAKCQGEIELFRNKRFCSKLQASRVIRDFNHMNVKNVLKIYVRVDCKM